jgi:hypothetical protein
VFVLDFDSGKEALRQLGIRQQSTLVAFKGKTEKRRSVADTEPAALRKVIWTSAIEPPRW